MQIIVKTHHVDITDALKEYAEKKCDKLEHFFDHINKIILSLSVEAASAEEDSQVASAIIYMNGSMVTAKETSGNMYSSVDLLVDKLAKQLKKYKEKLKNHRGHTAKQDFYDSKPTPSTSQQESLQPEPYIKKPMDVEDALLIIAEKKWPLLVFHNLKERVCVLYADHDHYNLIET